MLQLDSSKALILFSYIGMLKKVILKKECDNPNECNHFFVSASATLRIQAPGKASPT